MKYLGPTSHRRLNEAVAFVYLLAGFFVFISLASYHPFDPSANTATSLIGDAPGMTQPTNLTGHVGAVMSDLLLQGLGLGAYVIPVLIWLLGWQWVRSRPFEAPKLQLIGTMLFVGSTCTALGLIPGWNPIAGVIPAGGMLGLLSAQFLVGIMNMTGAVIVTTAAWVLSVYLFTTFELAHLPKNLRVRLPEFGRFASDEESEAVPKRKTRRSAATGEQADDEAASPARSGLFARLFSRLTAGSYRQRPQDEEDLPPAHTYAVEQEGEWDEAAAARMEERRRAEAIMAGRPVPEAASAQEPQQAMEFAPIVDPLSGPERAASVAAGAAAANNAPAPPLTHDTPPWEEEAAAGDDLDAIPIRELEPAPEVELVGMEVEPEAEYEEPRRRTEFRRPRTNLLQQPEERTPWDSAELKQTAADIKSKFEEFNVRGSIAQINPGPVVTTFEFKPEAGVKYSRITTLTEDLCLGLKAESIMIERIPGKSTVGIEVPNLKREVISLRQILESEEFTGSASPLTVALGKDINGRIKVANLDTMPHLLVAGSTGSGKSVMLNSLIMSILFKSTPNEVRMIMVDPKRLEFGLYEGIPHLLTPVITDAKKATNALRNAVMEMERRLKLLASMGVRNIDQYNKKVKKLREKPRSLFEDESEEELPEPIPYILILIDELADLMMLERANVEESVTRLAQMARAVGMHLVLATQRPSVDVITGLIKANFPSRISFRVATRVDSRTVLDSMGAEHLLGKGDMLYLPPGSSRLVRVHGSYVSESETNDVVEYWKNQAEPEYDKTYLMAPVNADVEEGAEGEEPEDPMYGEAVKVVCEMGKASTSTLQRRLRLGYGRAARILDMMQRDGIIGPPDGSRPREVLKAPDWIHEVESQMR